MSYPVQVTKVRVGDEKAKNLRMHLFGKCFKITFPHPGSSTSPLPSGDPVARLLVSKIFDFYHGQFIIVFQIPSLRVTLRDVSSQLYTSLCWLSIKRKEANS